jgi:AraC family transcriptional regulator
LADTYDQLMAWMAHQNLVPDKRMWEIYLSDPAQEPDPSKWRTRIFWPVSALPVTTPT